MAREQKAPRTNNNKYKNNSKLSSTLEFHSR